MKDKKFSMILKVIYFLQKNIDTNDHEKALTPSCCSIILDYIPQKIN